jgi:hypothetical protein
MEEPHSTRVVFFEQALRRLEEALAKPEDPIVRDACIQRFEFTFEMAWKAVQSYALALPSIPMTKRLPRQSTRRCQGIQICWGTCWKS